MEDSKAQEILREHTYQADTMKTPQSYVVCVDNSGYPTSLELKKIYRRLPDSAAQEDDFMRIVDESGEDYLYPARFFVPIAVPDAVAAVFAKAS